MSEPGREDARAVGEAKGVTMLEDVPMIEYGDYRSRREAGEWKQAWIVAHALDGGEREAAIRDWWRQVELDRVAGDVVWGDGIGPAGEDAIAWMGKAVWTIALGGLVIATDADLDLTPLALKWARVPAEAVAHVHREWATEQKEEGVDLIQNILAAMESGDLDRINNAARAAYMAVESITAMEKELGWPDDMRAKASARAVSAAMHAAHAARAELGLRPYAASAARLTAKTVEEAKGVQQALRMVSLAWKANWTRLERQAKSLHDAGMEKMGAAWLQDAAARTAANQMKVTGDLADSLPTRSEWARRWTLHVLQHLKAERAR